MLMRKVSTLTRVRRNVLAFSVRGTRIIVFIENYHTSLCVKHDLSMTVCIELGRVIRRSKEYLGDLVESR